MKTLKPSALLFAALLLTATLAACDSSGPDGDSGPVVEAATAEDVPANPSRSTGQYTFFDLRNGSIVLPDSSSNRADSSSTAWDVGFKGLNVITNGGTSGPGDGAGYVAERAFSEVTEVNPERLKADTEETIMLRDWYSYNANQNNYVRPIPGRTLVLRTADGEHYAKIKILSYYRGNPELPIDAPSRERPSRYYTFDYVLSGEPSFE